MGTVAGGYWDRMVRRFAGGSALADPDDLARQAERPTSKARDCACGMEATVSGRLRSVEFCPSRRNVTLEAELNDGTESVTLVWLGRGHIAGIEPGRVIRATGRVSIRDGRKVIYNPYYELQTAT